MKILNIYGQPSEHQEARIVGNRAGLEALHRAISRALSEEKSSTGDESEPLFASDGEGYAVDIVMNNEHWGMKDGAYVGTFWNREESNPEYTDYKQEGK